MRAPATCAGRGHTVQIYSRRGPRASRGERRTSVLSEAGAAGRDTHLPAARLAAQLRDQLEALPEPRGADGVPFGFKPAAGVDDPPAPSHVPAQPAQLTCARTAGGVCTPSCSWPRAVGGERGGEARPPWSVSSHSPLSMSAPPPPAGTSPRASYMNSSAQLKQSCTSTTSTCVARTCRRACIVGWLARPASRHVPPLQLLERDGDRETEATCGYTPLAGAAPRGMPGVAGPVWHA